MRKIYEVAREIKKCWDPINYYAKPYLDAMLEISNINDTYYLDDARSVVLYFLSNAVNWRGADARRLKAELKEMLK